MERKKKEVEIVGIANLFLWGIFPIYRVRFPNLHSYFRNNICFSLLKIIHLWNKICFSLSRIILLRDNICIYLLRIILLWNKICFSLLGIILLRDNIGFSLLRIILPNNVRTNFIRLISGASTAQCEHVKKGNPAMVGRPPLR